LFALLLATPFFLPRWRLGLVGNFGWVSLGYGVILGVDAHTTALLANTYSLSPSLGDLASPPNTWEW